MSDEWNGDEAKKMVQSKALGFITRAAIVVERRAKELLDIPGTAFSIAKGTKGKRLNDQVRSKPGEPPRKQTGQLRASITYEVDEKTQSARVGTNLQYGKALELGSKRGLKPRPFLRRALYEMQANVNELLGKIGKDE